MLDRQKTCHCETFVKSRSNLKNVYLPNLPRRSFFAAFTLAEVLITLGIIGVVAAITIPTLMQNQQEKATVTALKNAESILSDAFTLAIKEDGTPDNWDLLAPRSSQGALNVLAKISPYLSITKNCGIDLGCMPSDYKWLNGSTDNGSGINSVESSKVGLNNGYYLYFMVRDINCSLYRGNTNHLKNVCGLIAVDVNGDKVPNQFGRDTFFFLFTKYGIIPYSTIFDTAFPFDSYCRDKAAVFSGWGCTAWVLYNENMDYLHCNTLSWNGPTTCN